MRIIAPDCRDGKHTACIGDAWDVEHDIPADCTCSCHADPEPWQGHPTRPVSDAELQRLIEEDWERTTGR